MYPAADYRIRRDRLYRPAEVLEVRINRCNSSRSSPEMDGSWSIIMIEPSENMKSKIALFTVSGHWSAK